MPKPKKQRRGPRARRRWAAGVLTLGLVLLAGCSRFKAAPAENYVYVTAKQANLRDRVAAVSNRVGQVENGDKLTVLDHGRHWVKVRTAKGEVGWIEEKSVATGETAATFDTLKQQHSGDAEVASGVVRDQVYMHIKPGRDSEHFYLLNEGEHLKLLRRASLLKLVTPQTVARAQRAIPQAAGSDARRKDVLPTPAAQTAAAPEPVYEDWWLVRDSQAHTGWVLSRMMDVDAPDALTRYAEGQRIVGAYVLSHVHDEEAPGEVKDVPVYVTVMSPYKAGLPYDFDQVRVFTWSLQHHRYETGFRDRNIEGFLPVSVSKLKDPAQKGALGGVDLPAFSYRVLAGGAAAATPDSTSGEVVPGRTVTKTYRLEGNLVRRLLPPGTAAPEEAHPVAEVKKDKKGKGKAK